MRKRKKYGYFLLTMLIVSGLAGTPTDNSLSKKERKFASEHLKNTKADLIATIKDFDETQLNFKSSIDMISALDCVYHLVATENYLWQLLEKTMKSAVNPEKRNEITFTDEKLINTIQDKSFAINSNAFWGSKNSTYKSLDAALLDFKDNRADFIKYVRNSTEDLRNHIVETPIGWLDCYQIILLISSNSNRLTQQIIELKSQPGFPK